ncbi:MAG: uracil-DNA glycosylase [Treponema sp.]|nr:uracil-DNA glycosylase [Treponema sp.]
MKKEEKELIYNLLKTAEAYETGYSSKAFAVAPEFTDDVEAVAENTAEETTTNRASVQGADTDAMEVVTQTGASGSTTTNPLSPSDDALPKAGLSLEELTAKIMRCTRCQLARTRNNVVPGIGVKNPEVMVIGEGPGYDEDMKGEPFVGKAGVLLDKMLNAINLDRHTNCYIANIVKCRPPQNRDPFPEEQAACISFLEAQIHILKPKMILCMGRISGQKLLNSQAPMAQLHGKVFEYNGIPLMVTYHPSALLRNEELKRPAWEDLKAFRRKLDELK